MLVLIEIICQSSSGLLLFTKPGAVFKLGFVFEPKMLNMYGTIYNPPTHLFTSSVKELSQGYSKLSDEYFPSNMAFKS